MSLTLDLDRDEFAEALYTAHLTAVQIALTHPSTAPPTVVWTELAESTRALWTATAERLLALYGCNATSK